MQTLRSEKGQTLVITALFMSAMLGFLALALDIGILFRARRNMQIAADAAATAGAMNYYFYKDADKAIAAAKGSAKLNHFEDGVDSNSVVVNVPPLAGPNQSKGFVEVVVSKPIPVIFMGVFSRSSMAVAARAVAGAPGWSENCVFVMNPHGADTFDLQGNATVDAPHCGVYVNSDNGNAMHTTGSSTTYTGPAVDVVGGYSYSGHGLTNVDTGASAQSPPIPTSLAAPKTPDACGYTSTATSVTTSTQAAIQSGAAINGVVCFTKAVLLDNGVSLPGSASGVDYVFENGVTIGSAKTDMVTFGSATRNADGTFSDTKGATIILTGGTLTQKTGGNQAAGLTVYAPADATNPYNGIALMIPTSNTSNSTLTVQWGNTNAVFDGIIFAPGETVYLQDHGGGVTAAGVICDKMFVKSSTFSIPSYSAANPFTTPFKQITLVE